MRRPRSNKTGFNRERANTCQYVAAILHITDTGFLRLHLQKQLVDVGFLPCRRTDNRYLVSQRMAAADTVDLQWIRPAHDLEKDPVAQACITGQILAAKIDAA